jgi:hypothetical protein
MLRLTPTPGRLGFKQQGEPIMDPIGKQKEHEQDHHEVLVIQDAGAASKMTRGTAIEFPWLEIGPPPFNHWCPSC